MRHTPDQPVCWLDAASLSSVFCARRLCADFALRVSTCCHHESELQCRRSEHVRGRRSAHPRAEVSGQAGCAGCVHGCGGRETGGPFSCRDSTALAPILHLPLPA
eukprot:scaffold114676_cov57-Phaeocystis_antarctica.AAC.2